MAVFNALEMLFLFFPFFPQSSPESMKGKCDPEAVRHKNLTTQAVDSYPGGQDYSGTTVYSLQCLSV